MSAWDTGEDMGSWMGPGRTDGEHLPALVSPSQSYVAGLISGFLITVSSTDHSMDMCEGLVTAVKTGSCARSWPSCAMPTALAGCRIRDSTLLAAWAGCIADVVANMIRLTHSLLALVLAAVVLTGLIPTVHHLHAACAIHVPHHGPPGHVPSLHHVATVAHGRTVSVPQARGWHVRPSYPKTPAATPFRIQARAPPHTRDMSAKYLIK
jgi:hypothetical protein